MRPTNPTPEQRAQINAAQRDYYARNRSVEQQRARGRRERDDGDKARARYWADPEIARARNRERYAAKREERRAAARAYRLANPEKIRAKKRKAAYGITADAYHALWASQGGCCPLCSQPLVEANRRTHVDHDHATGAVRGLLCADCNVGLGRFRDNAGALRRAAAYVERVYPGSI